MQHELEEHYFMFFLIFIEMVKATWATVILVHTTYIIMEGFCFTGVITGFSPLRCSTVQVPEYTVHKMGHEAKTNMEKKTQLFWMFTCEQDAKVITYHHQECRNPGGSPSVMFFSHRICKNGMFMRDTDVHSKLKKSISIHLDPSKPSERAWTFPPTTYTHTHAPHTSDKKVCADFCAPMCSKYS